MHVQCTAPNQLFLTANSKNLTLKWCSLYCTKTVLDENQILPAWIMCLIALLSCITSGRNFNEHEKFMVKYGWLLLLLFSWVATTWTLSHQWLHFTILLISLADISRNRSFLQWDDRLRSIPIFFLRFIDCILLMINGRKRPLTPLSSYLSLVKLNTSEIIQVKKEKVILMAQSDR